MVIQSDRWRLGWIASPQGDDGSAYKVAPPAGEEFSGEDESVSWEAGGWEEFH